MLSHTTALVMKTTLTLCLALAAAATAHAQIFRTEAINGAVGRAHASAGRSGGDGRSNDRGGDRDGRRDHGGHVYRSDPRVHVGIGYGPSYRGYGYSPYRHSHVGYHDGYFYGPRSYGYRVAYAPAYGYYSGYGYGYPYYDGYGYYGGGSAAANGLLLGALAGGIIGHNSGEFRHNGWRGAAWGAGAGWLLGTIVDANRRAVAYPAATAVTVPTQPVVQTQAQPAQPQQVTIINNYYNSSTPMSAANGMFGR